MYKNILNENQLELLPLIAEFSREFYLVGGTAVALHIGHRQSIDFDLFKTKRVNGGKIVKKVEKYFSDYDIIYKETDQLHFLINNVKVTFLQYEFDIPHNIRFENIIKIPTLLDLAVMKSYALGRRAKWKDYVDLFFILKHKHCFEDICERSKQIYGSLFSEKLFKQKLCYFNDIDYSEKVVITDKSEVDEQTVKDFLTEIAIKPF